MTNIKSNIVKKKVMQVVDMSQAIRANGIAAGADPSEGTVDLVLYGAPTPVFFSAQPNIFKDIVATVLAHALLLEPGLDLSDLPAMVEERRALVAPEFNKARNDWPADAGFTPGPGKAGRA